MNKIKLSREDKIFDLITYIILGLILVTVVYPLYFVVIASISEPTEVINGNVILLPKQMAMTGYERVFRDSKIITGYINSIIYTVGATSLGVLITMMIAYPLSRSEFSGKGWITLLIFIPMYFGGGLIPTYLQMKAYGLLGSRWSVILMGCISTYNIIIARTFLKSNIPKELIEAGKLDGCSDFKFFFTIVPHLSGALIAVLVLYYGVGHWNDYFNAMIYLKGEDQYPLQLVLRTILLQTQNATTMMDDLKMVDELMRAAEQIKYAVIIVASLPMLILYPFLQKYFVKGVMIGSVKG